MLIKDSFLSTFINLINLLCIEFFKDHVINLLLRCITMKTNILKLIISSTSFMILSFHISSYSAITQFANYWVIHGGVIKIFPESAMHDSVQMHKDHKIKLISSKSTDNILLHPNIQFHLSQAYLFSPHFGMGLFLASPFHMKHSFKSAENSTAKLFIKQFSSVLFLHYYPFETCNLWQPYVRFGILYNRFFDGKFKVGSKMITAFSEFKIKFKHSLGIAGQAGLDYYFSPAWSLGFSAMYSTFSSKFKIKYKQTNKIREKKDSIKFSPSIYRLNIGYRF